MYPIISENENIKVTEEYIAMDDGVRLYTRVAVPKMSGSIPVVFIRTPYEKTHDGCAHDIESYKGDMFIQNGYAVVLQHCRGTGDSEGRCIPYVEREDGLKTLEYIRNLPFYNGEIFLSGHSYLASVHLLYIGENPPDVKGAALAIQTDRLYYRYYRNGCNYNYGALDWWLKMMKRQYPHPNLEGTIRRPYKDLMKRIVGEDVPRYTAGLLNDTYNHFWVDDPRTYAMDNLRIPILLTGGWYDYYTEGMFSMWDRLPAGTKEKSVFVVGPWGHKTALTGKEEYPMENGNIPVDFAVQWFNSIREGKAYPYAETGKVNYYSIGGNFWKVGEYPHRAKCTKRLYFDTESRMTENTPKEVLDDGTFDSESEKRSYVYDPEKRLNFFRYNVIYKAPKMNSVEGVLSFVSEEFTEETCVYGEIRWRMRVSSDCEDTAFFMRVYFVEDGESYNLTETITSLSYICSDYMPGEIATIDLLTPPVAFTLKPGMRIRVDVASDSGSIVSHANVRGHWAEVEECKIAVNSVYIRDSFIELPLA